MPSTETTLPKENVLEVIKAALKDHPLEHHFGNALKAYERMHPKNMTVEDFRALFAQAMMRLPKVCDRAPAVVGGRETETLEQIRAHQEDCADCTELITQFHDLKRQVYTAVIRYSDTGQVEQPSQDDAIPGPENGHTLYCSACGQPYKALRLSSRTCSDACRARLSRMRKQQP